MMTLNSDEPSQAARPSRRGGSLFRLTQKELRETLRDRRTIVTLIAMPLIVYPILSLVFKTFLLSNLGTLGADNRIQYRFAVFAETERSQVEILLGQINAAWEAKTQSQQARAKEQDGEAENASGEEPAGESGQLASTGSEQGVEGETALPGLGPGGRPEVAPFLDHQWEITPFQKVDPVSFLKENPVDVLIRFYNRPADDRGPSQIVSEVFYNDDTGPGRSAARYFQERLNYLNQVILQQRLQRAELFPFVPYEVTDRPLVLAEADKSKASLASIIPLILVLMTITGAVYPAIDLTAGERERGTLETLIAAPLPRMRVLVAKMFAVITVAILTATLNVMGMATTIWAFQLESMLLGDAGFTVWIFLKIFGLLSLFATFFAALLLVVTSFARSFKEAQAYLIPIILLSLGPGLIAMTPGLKLEGPLAVCPMINLLLLSRDVLEGQVSLLPAAVAIFSTCVYALIAIAAAASIFGADSILYGGQSSWKELMMRPLEEAKVAPLNVALLCLFLLLPINFVSIALLGRLPKFFGEDVTLPVDLQLGAMALFTFLAFFLFPTMVAVHQRIRIGSGFGVRNTRPQFWLLALILGLGSWPVVMAMINGWYDVLRLMYGAETTDVWHDRLSEFCARQADNFRGASPWMIGLAMSLIPAFCEEWFFRGMFQRSLLRVCRPWIAILASAITFGVFHTLSGSVASFDRLIPTTMMGVMLGMIAYRSDSLLPGILLHSVHNATIAFIAYYLPALNQLSWFPQDAETIPWSWTLLSGILAVGGIVCLLWLRRPDRKTAHTGLS